MVAEALQVTLIAVVVLSDISFIGDVIFPGSVYMVPPAEFGCDKSPKPFSFSAYTLACTSYPKAKLYLAASLRYVSATVQYC